MSSFESFKSLYWKLVNTYSPTKNRLLKFRMQWGQPGRGERLLAGRYFELTNNRVQQSAVDEKTWSDLEFEQIFSDMDTTATLTGSQVLFSQLRTLEISDTDMQSRRAVYREMTENPQLRERCQILLSGFEKRSCGHLVDYLFGDEGERRQHKIAWLLWSMVSIGAFLGFVFQLLPVWGWIAVLMINFLLIIKTHWRVHRDYKVVAACVAMLNAADALGARYNCYPALKPLFILSERRRQRAKVRRSLIWLSIVKREPLSWIMVWLNVFCVVELLLHSLTVGRFFRMRSLITRDFELVGSIDAAIAVASFQARYDVCCEPVLTNQRALILVDVRHPLLPEGVKNSIRLVERSALITGSNMAGKTTFIKALGTNAILAQTLGFCLASHATIPRANVLASVRSDHSVASGKSHYFAEIERIKFFFDTAQTKRGSLLLIDELFSGTNTVERVAIARSVLESLAEGAIVLATTHDVELQDVLGACFDAYHFREDPEVDGYFDYRLREGVTRMRNAIRMLGELGFPESVISKAIAYANDPNLR